MSGLFPVAGIISGHGRSFLVAKGNFLPGRKNSFWPQIFFFSENPIFNFLK
jgi:hypothetical protein